MQPLNSPPPRLLDQLRERLRYRHYSLSTEKLYVYWARFFIRFHGLRHPRDMGGPEIGAFLTHLANERQVSPSTHKQALSAILFLYKEVLGQDLPWMQEIGRPRAQTRLPVVLTVPEVLQTLVLLDAAQPVHGLFARLRVKGLDCLWHALSGTVNEWKSTGQLLECRIQRPWAKACSSYA